MQAGTAGLARARPDELGGPVDELRVAGEQPLREPDAAGHRLVQVDRRRLVVRRPDLRHEPEVPRVDHQQHRRHGLDRPPGADQRHVQLVAPPAGAGPLGGEPVGGRLELDLGQVHRAPAHVLVGDELELLVQRDEARRPSPRRGRARPPVAGASANTSSGLSVTARFAYV